jgi:hypothetical protein
LICAFAVPASNVIPSSVVTSFLMTASLGLQVVDAAMNEGTR